ncbi:MAG: hypothetical protein MZV64_10005 [Ignavibacteriales bacterium]|nr:hypothetical protein [Ignavibacteriales bacterium]
MRHGFGIRGSGGFRPPLADQPGRDERQPPTCRSRQFQVGQCRHGQRYGPLQAMALAQTARGPAE